MNALKQAQREEESAARRAEYERERADSDAQQQKRWGEFAARRAAGLGFGRLVWIIACGILLAQAISGLAIAAFNAFLR